MWILVEIAIRNAELHHWNNGQVSSTQHDIPTNIWIIRYLTRYTKGELLTQILWKLRRSHVPSHFQCPVNRKAFLQEQSQLLDYLFKEQMHGSNDCRFSFALCFAKGVRVVRKLGWRYCVFRGEYQLILYRSPLVFTVSSHNEGVSYRKKYAHNIIWI